MTSLTGKYPKDTYGDLLQISNGNVGIDATLRNVEDGMGTQCPLQLSATQVNIQSGFQLGGTAITSTASQINTLATGTPAAEYYRVGALGDSITNISYTSDSDEKNYNLQGWVSWLRILSRQTVEIPATNIIAVDGIDTAGIISGGYHTAMAALGLDICIIELGVNDAASASLTPSQTAANFDTIISTILASGCAVVLQPILPTTTPNGLNAANQKKANTINAYMRAKARTDRRIILSDPTPAYIDGAVNTGVPLSGYSYDGLHPATQGAYILGKTHWASIQELVPPYDRRFMNGLDVYDASANINGNLLTNGLLIGTTGTTGGGGGSGVGVSGNIATSWDVARFGTVGTATCVCSKVTRTDGESGVWQQLVLGGTPAAAGYFRFLQVVNVGGYAVGDQVELVCEFEVDSGFSNLTSLRLEIFDVNNTGPVTFSTRDGNGTASQPINNLDTIRGVLRTPIHTVQTGSNFLAISMNLNYDSAAISSTVRIGRMSLRKVT